MVRAPRIGLHCPHGCTAGRQQIVRSQRRLAQTAPGFSPVGFGGATVKIAPPLITPEDAILDGCQVLEQAITEVLA